MVNLLWGGTIIFAIIIAGINGNIGSVTQIIFSSAEKAVSIAFGLISVMTFWLGIMKIIEKSGFINIVIYLSNPMRTGFFRAFPVITRS